MKVEKMLSKISYFAFILCFISCCVIEIVSGKSIEEKCKTLDVENVLKGCALVKGLSIKSRGGTLVNDSNCDVLLPKRIFEAEPEILLPLAEDGKLYTLLFLDPDAETKEPGKLFLHALKSNIQGSDLKKGCVCSGTWIQPYLGPAPPKGTDDHRYIFLIFEQEKENKDSKEITRLKFNLSTWVKDSHLCGPIGGVQFRATYEI